MHPFRKSWTREARVLSGVSAAVSVTMFAQLAISAIETLIVARLGVDVLAGVTIATGVDLLAFLFALGVVTAVTPIAARAHGAGDLAALRSTGQQGLWVGLMFSLPGAAVLFGLGAALPALTASSAQTDSAAGYLLGSAWGLPAWVSYVAIRCLAIATGRVRITTAVMLASIPVHAGLSWLLVFGGWGAPALGAFGAGLAYSLTGYAALGLVAVLLRRSSLGEFGSALRPPFVFDRAPRREIIRLGVPFACRIMLSEGVPPAAAMALAFHGPTALAAHAVAATAISLTGVFSFGFSDAANMRVSRAIGAGSPRRARLAGWAAVHLAALVSALAAGTIIVAPLFWARSILGEVEPAALQAAAALLPIAACLQFLEGVQSGAGGALSGLRDAKGPLLISILGSWGIGVPAGILLAGLAPDPASGMWLGLMIGGMATTALYLLRLRRKFAAL